MGKHVRVKHAENLTRGSQSRLYAAAMRKFLTFGLLSIAFASCSTPPEPATKLERAAVLPLEINDNFQFRKIKQAFFAEGPSAGNRKANPSISSASACNGER